MMMKCALISSFLLFPFSSVRNRRTIIAIEFVKGGNECYKKPLHTLAYGNKNAYFMLYFTVANNQTFDCCCWWCLRCRRSVIHVCMSVWMLNEWMKCLTCYWPTPTLVAMPLKGNSQQPLLICKRFQRAESSNKRINNETVVGCFISTECKIRFVHKIRASLNNSMQQI